jgi:acetolactate synthase-1/3 small subunit
MRHIIAILLENEAGALTRVAGLFSSRGYNIESLSVAPTEDPRVSRLTLVTTGDDAVITQIVSQLNKLVDVVQVQDMTRGQHFERELLLIKLRAPADQLPPLKLLVDESGGRVLDGAADTLVVELTSGEAQINRFIAAAGQRAEIVEVVRSGALAVASGPRALGLDNT